VRSLHECAAMGDREALLASLKSGAEVNEYDEDGLTPLHYAAAMGRSGIAALLIDHGADPQLPTIDGKNAVEVAIFNNWPETARFLRSIVDGQVGEPQLGAEQLRNRGLQAPRYTQATSEPRPLFRAEYEDVYVSFGEGGIVRYSDDDWDSWTGRQKREVPKFWQELERAVIAERIVQQKFAEGWMLDGAFHDAVRWDTENKDVLFGFGGSKATYWGCWLRLKRIVS